MAGYVLDTSAVMALLIDEAGARTVRDVVYGSETVRLPFMVLMEVEYRLLQRAVQNVEQTLATIEAWPVLSVESNRRWRSQAAQVKAVGGLSLADAWIASLALLEDAELVHKDPEFDAIPQLKHLRLPYTPPTTGRRRS